MGAIWNMREGSSNRGTFGHRQRVQQPFPMAAIRVHDCRNGEDGDRDEGGSW